MPLTPPSASARPVTTGSKTNDRSARLAVLLSLSSALALGACGGGGDSSSLAQAAAPIATPAPAPGQSPVPAPSPGPAASSPAPGPSPAPAPGPAPGPAPSPSPSALTASGTATYDFVPTNANGRGLNYSAVIKKPIRGATAQLLDGAGGVIASTTTDALGAYSFPLTDAQALAPLAVRVRAEIKRSGAATGEGDRDLSVRDNTNGEALYVLDSSAITPGASSAVVNVNAASGWGTSTYTATRASAPFAILDVAYAGQAKVAAAAPTQALEPLKLFWSPNNQPASGDPAVGNIGTSSFMVSGGVSVLYLLGKDGVDTDEFDDHVVQHEFGHYLQNAISRDDSIGGAHSLGDKLDMRLAFSEGWGNAWSGMAQGTPIYADSSGNAQAAGFSFNLSAAPVSNRGWYSEDSIQFLLYSAHQNGGIGFQAIYAALRNLTLAPSFTSLFSFTEQLRLAAPAQVGAINSLWQGQLVSATDGFGAGETNNGGSVDNLPIYRTHTAALGSPANYCVNTVNDPLDDGNKLGRHVFITFSASGPRTLNVTRSGGTFAGTSDPDFALLKSDGTRRYARSATNNVESLQLTLPAGTHVLALEDFLLTAPRTSCFNFTVN